MSQPCAPSQVSSSLRQLQSENDDLRRYLDAQKKVIASLERRVGRSLNSLGVHMKHLVSAEYSSADWERSIDSVQDQVSSLCDLLADAMLLQKLEAGKVEVQLEYLPLAPLLSSVTRHLNKDGNSTRLIYEFTSGSIFAWVDQELLEAVLIDLLARSLRYSDSNSPIVLGMKSTEGEAHIYITAQRFAPIDNCDFATEIMLCCRRIEAQAGKVTCYQRLDGLQTVTLALQSAVQCNETNAEN